MLNIFFESPILVLMGVFILSGSKTVLEILIYSNNN